MSGRQVSKVVWASGVRASHVPGVRCPKCIGRQVSRRQMSRRQMSKLQFGGKGPGVTCHRRQVSIEDGALSVSASLVHVIGVRCQSLFYIKCLGVGCPKSIRGRKSGHRCLGVRSTGVKRVPPVSPTYFVTT